MAAISWGWLVRARCLKPGGDDDAAELGGHVGGGGLGLAVAGDGDLGELCGCGQLRQGREAVSSHL
jgi:hypothetical protein